MHEGPKFNLKCGDHTIKWRTSFKYPGYWISPKLDWSKMISKSVFKIRQRIVMINLFRLYGTTSRELCRVLFSCHILSIFTWLFPLFSDYQRVFLTKFYYTCLKRVLHIHQWSNLLFAFAQNEISLESRCTRYWIKYLKALNSSTDGDLLLEQLILNSHKESWRRGEQRIWYLRRSKRFASHDSVIQKCLPWYEDNPLADSIPSSNMMISNCSTLFQKLSN